MYSGHSTVCVPGQTRPVGGATAFADQTRGSSNRPSGGLVDSVSLVDSLHYCLVAGVQSRLVDSGQFGLVDSLQCSLVVSVQCNLVDSLQCSLVISVQFGPYRGQQATVIRSRELQRGQQRG